MSAVQAELLLPQVAHLPSLPSYEFCHQLAMPPHTAAAASAEPSLAGLLLAPLPGAASPPPEWAAEGQLLAPPAGGFSQGHQPAVTGPADEALDLASPSLQGLSPEERRALLAAQAQQAQQLRHRRDEQQRWCAAAQRLLQQAGTADDRAGQLMECCPAALGGGRVGSLIGARDLQDQAAAEAAAAAEQRCKRLRAQLEAAQLRQVAEWEARRAQDQRRWEARRAREQAEWEEARRREQAEWQAAQAVALQQLQRQLAELERGALPPHLSCSPPGEQLTLRGSAPACMQQSDWWRSGGVPQPRRSPPPAGATSPMGFHFERSLTSTDRSARGTRSMEQRRPRADVGAQRSRKRSSSEAGMPHVPLPPQPLASAAPTRQPQPQDWDMQTHAWMVQQVQQAEAAQRTAGLLGGGGAQTTSAGSRHSRG